MTFLYQENTDISVWSVFLFSCHVWETTVQSTTRQWTQSPQPPTHGNNSSQIKEQRAMNLLRFLISFKDPHRQLQISTHKAACMTCWASKGPQQLQKAQSGARWQAESPATPHVCPPLQQSATFTRPRWIKQTLLLTKRAVSFHIQAASLCYTLWKALNLLRKQEVSHIQPSTNSKLSLLIAVTFVTQN